MHCLSHIFACKLQPNAVYNRNSLSQSTNQAESGIAASAYSELGGENSAGNILPPTATRDDQRLK